MKRAVGHGRKWALVGAGAAMAIAIGLSPAWACTATPFITLGPTQSAVPGTELTANVYAATGLATGRADLRLIEGDALTRTLESTTATAGKDLVVPFTVPDLTPGVHYLALENGGRIVARAPFEVLAAGERSAAGASSLRQQDPRPTSGVTPALAGASVAGLGVLALAVFGLTTSRRRRTVEIRNT